jgi:protein-tyrosine-phosphatase
MSELKKILFVCVENAGRSQMAESFFKKYAPREYEAISVGTKPAPIINPIVVEAMQEIGIDLSKQQPKVITNEIINDSILHVNMGCIDKTQCPAIFMKNSVDWNIEDPKGKSIEQVRLIRNDVELKIKQLCENLE